MATSQRRTVELSKDGKVLPMITLVRSKPEIAAALSKLTNQKGKTSKFNSRGEKTIDTPNKSGLINISSNISNRIKDAETTLQMFPELELASQILVSSIISPKDLTGSEINYKLDSDKFPPAVTTKVLTLLKDYFTKDHKIKSLLPKILKDSLFITGSYPIAVIPESSLDEFINGKNTFSTESFKEYVGNDGAVKGYGILGDPDKVKTNTNRLLPSMESYTSNSDYNSKLSYSKIRSRLITITDNINVLKFPTLQKKLVSKNVISAYKNSTIKSFAFEAHKEKFTDARIHSLIYKNQDHETKELDRIKPSSQTNRDNVGEPLIMHLPSTSVIPIHVPGDESAHIAYFIVLDGEGNPISQTSPELNNSLNDRLSIPNGNMDSALLNKMNSNMTSSGRCSEFTLENATRVYGDIIEADLLARLKNGIYNSDLSVAHNSEIYRIMFARTLMNKSTQILFIPKELLVYFAFKFDNNGIGKSILEDMKGLNSLRSMLLFARTMAALRNSIPRTKVKLKLDEDDPDPQQTIETAIHEITSMRGQTMFPFGVNDPRDLTTWIQKAGYEFTFEGHPSIPDVNIDFDEVNSNYTKPDDELFQETKKSSIMGTGISPESIDAASGPEFATSVVANNLLLAKRVMQIQEVLLPLFTEYARIVVKNHGGLISKIRKIITEDFDSIVEISKNDDDGFNYEQNQHIVINYLIDSFIESFILDLPSPDTATEDSLSKAFTDHQELLEKAIEHYVNDAIVNSDMAGELGQNADMYKKLLSSHFMREWLSKNNVLPELNELISIDENGGPVTTLIASLSDHVNALTKAFSGLKAKTEPVKKASDDALNRITGGEGIEEVNVGSSSDSGSSDDSGGGDMGDDNFGSFDDFGAEEEEPVEESTEETTEEEPKEDKEKTEE